MWPSVAVVAMTFTENPAPASISPTEAHVLAAPLAGSQGNCGSAIIKRGGCFACATAILPPLPTAFLHLMVAEVPAAEGLSQRVPCKDCKGESRWTRISRHAETTH